MEINIRKFVLSPGAKLFADYQDHIDMVETCMPGSVYVRWNDTDDDHVETRIYQYYSIAPIYGLEANFLRRLEAGKSVTAVRQGIRRYIGSKRAPGWMKKIAVRYLRWFFNSMDYIVVPDHALREELLAEGIRSPQIRVIFPTAKGGETSAAAQWLELYERMWESVILPYPYRPEYVLQKNRSFI